MSGAVAAGGGVDVDGPGDGVSGGIDKVIDVVAAGVSGGIDNVIDVVGAGGGAAVAGAGGGGAVLLVGTGGGVGGGVDVVAAFVVVGVAGAVAVALAGSVEPGVVVDPVVVEPVVVVGVVVPAGGCVESSVDDAAVGAGEPLSVALSVVDVDVAEPLEGAGELELVSPVVVVWPEVAGAVDGVVSVEPALAAADADVPSSAAAGCAIASAVPTVHNAASSKSPLHELPDLVPATPVTAPASGTRS